MSHRKGGKISFIRIKILVPGLRFGLLRFGVKTMQKKMAKSWTYDRMGGTVTK